jgi:hypothetical protein
MTERRHTFSFDALRNGELGLTASGGKYFSDAASY